ncbi:MAG: SHOCT domain-containing protein [Pseudomonadota bacterium]
MKKLLTVTFLVATLVSLSAEAARKIENLVNLPVPDRVDGSKFTLAEVRALIMQGCTKREWKPETESDSVLTCAILVRGRHYVKVEIPFSETAYSILYLDSEEMNYNEAKQTIHRKYNGWVENLRMMIDWQFRDAAELPAGETLVEQPSDAAGDERYEALLKLGELRDKGLISDEEFEAEKRKLLGDGE